MTDQQIHVRCEACGYEMSVPRRYEGSVQKCRKCGSAFNVPGGPETTPTTALQQTPISPGEPPSSSGRRPCPYCAEMIKPEATICPFCRKKIPINKLDEVGTQMQEIGCAITKIVWGGGCLLMILVFLFFMIFS